MRQGMFKFEINRDGLMAFLSCFYVWEDHSSMIALNRKSISYQRGWAKTNKKFRWFIQTRGQLQGQQLLSRAVPDTRRCLQCSLHKTKWNMQNELNFEKEKPCQLFKNGRRFSAFFCVRGPSKLHLFNMTGFILGSFVGLEMRAWI